MKRMLWLLIAVVTIAGLFVGSCGGGGDDSVDGGGGVDGVVDTLTLLFWQAPTMANPYLSPGNKESEAAALVLEPLANYDENGALVPRLAASIPTVENGGVSADRTLMTWKLKAGVRWSDGTALTAEDVVFTYDYACALPEGNCEDEPVENLEALDDLTLQITFKSPQSYPYARFVGAGGGVVLQQAQFEHCLGEAARQCETENLYPIGTGPYKIADFQVEETIVYEINEHFRIPGQPFFSEVILKGGGSAIDAARSVLETGDADYAWNMQVTPDVLQSLQALGKGTLVNVFASTVERLAVNFTNPDPDLGDKRSEWSADDPNPHPFLSDPEVRRALSLAIDRRQIAEQLYGPAGEPTCNVITAPPQYVSPHNDDCLEQDIEAAKAVLTAAGWLPDPDDGIRQKDGVRLSILYQTSTNAVRQQTQALIQGWWEEIGVETELKDINAAEFFGGDPEFDDTVGRFYADIQMYADGSSVAPQSDLGRWRTSEIARYENNWGGRNIPRWFSPAYDAAYDELEGVPLGPKHEDLIIELNDLLVQNHVLIPLVNRALVSPAVSNRLKGIRFGAWDAELWNIHEWYRE